MRNRNKAYVISIALLLGALVIIVPTQPAKAQFVLSYDYSTDNYGNAIAYINAYFDEDYNGTMYFDPDSYPTSTAINPLECLEGTEIMLEVVCWLNATYAGVSEVSEGQNVIQHNVTVLLTNGTVIFSQQNFTYLNGIGFSAPMFLYSYGVDLDFVPVSGQIYTVTVIYEVYGM